MPANSATLGIDIGTSSCKALLLDESGAVLATHSVAYDVAAPRPGWSEQDPESWVAGARAAISGLLAKRPSVKISAIGLSGQMHGLTALDEAHKVLRPAILWNDQRNAAECAEITEAVGGLPRLLAETNNRMLPGYTGGKILWMRKHEPDLFRRMRHILNPKDYLRLCLTGEAATEVSDASGTGLFDVRQRRWSKAVIDAIGLDERMLPSCYESDVVSGRVSAGAARLFGLEEGIPVVGGGGDSVIQTIGSGVIDPGDLQTTIGTAGILACALDKPRDNPDGRLQVFCNVAADRWHCMGVSLNAGGALSWLRSVAHGFGDLSEAGWHDIPFERFMERAAESPAGARGLVFLPYLNGERCPYPDPEARGAFLGLTSRHNESDMIRSVLEGVVFALRDIFSLMAEAGIEARRLRASGGGAASAFWRQIQADIFGCDVVTTEGAAEGGAFGAAIVAGVGTGLWPDAAAAARVCKPVSRQSPQPATQAIYERMFDTYKELYPLLRTSFSKLCDPIYDAEEVAA
ncbi:MAG: xylulokinase [Shinella sp.]|jgi:xylulokinase|nr:xylulokinase [Shinella sp.]